MKLYKPTFKWLTSFCIRSCPLTLACFVSGRDLQSKVGHILLANSITLTPGTITVDLTDGTYLVHALAPGAAGSLLEAKMQSRLEAIFGEPEEPQPEIRWVQEDGSMS